MIVANIHNDELQLDTPIIMRYTHNHRGEASPFAGSGYPDSPANRNHLEAPPGGRQQP